ncbi:MAG: alginate lyase family protein, partial [Candidatus Limnocylindrales bacterium]
GTHAGAARATIAVYLNDGTELARTATVFRGWLGDRGAYSGFKYGSDLSWQDDATRLVAIDAAGTSKVYDGKEINLDGALPDEMRRGGTFQWAPLSTGYPWEALQGAVLQAEVLDHAGYESWTWSNRALYRAARFLYSTAGWPATGDDRWQPWLIDARTGAGFPRPSTTSPGKNFGFADWLYGN